MEALIRDVTPVVQWKHFENGCKYSFLTTDFEISIKNAT